MSPSAYGRSLIRTVVPIVVGAVVGWLATRGVEVDSASLIPAVDAVAAAAYYALVRAAEQRWPALGWLLGAPGAPSYSAPVPVDGAGPGRGESLPSDGSGGDLGGSGGLSA